MLARRHRVTQPAEFRTILHRGRVSAGQFVVVHSVQTSPDTATAIGFVVGKRVGNAMTRNLVKRRLRAKAFEFVKEQPVGTHSVVRAKPAAAHASWAALSSDFSHAYHSAVTRAAQ